MITQGLERILLYIARQPISKERLAYDKPTGTVTIFFHKDHARVVDQLNALNLLA